MHTYSDTWTHAGAAGGVEGAGGGGTDTGGGGQGEDRQDSL